MKVWMDLIDTDYGLVSLISIAMMLIGMLYFVIRHLTKK
ncbi:MAG: DUF3149 domain-containing protein [Methylophilaceae bacterium]|nr:DUF3149 domain-containing protein [Methylophilaceae bacterium]